MEFYVAIDLKREKKKHLLGLRPQALIVQVFSSRLLLFLENNKKLFSRALLEWLYLHETSWRSTLNNSEISSSCRWSISWFKIYFGLIQICTSFSRNRKNNKHSKMAFCDLHVRLTATKSAEIEWLFCVECEPVIAFQNKTNWIFSSTLCRINVVVSLSLRMCIH